jgi:tRNA threonylcarbamoyladenosine biosynthesis protein TsaE
MHMQIPNSLTTASSAATKKFASILAKEIARTPSDRARVIALSGNLGAGKTTFTQGFAKALGIARPVQSPTFVVMKIYELEEKYLKHLVHIDAYRIETSQELDHLGFRELLKDKDAVILIEWADRVKKILPKDTMWLTFEHGKTMTERLIIFSKRQ